MSKPGDDFKIGIGFFVFGLILFYDALKKYRIRQHIQNIPRSKIASAAMGNFVEVQGRIFCEDDSLILSPLSKTKCANYYWEIQREVKHKRGSEWVTLASYLGSEYLFIKDESDEIAAVDLAHGQFHEEEWTHSKYFRPEAIDALAPQIKEIIIKKKFHETADSSFQAHRIMERALLPEESVYVLGMATEIPADKIAKSNRSKSYLSRSKFLFTISNLAGSSLDPKKVFISKHSEEKLVNKLSWDLWGSLILGPILMGFGAWLLLHGLAS